MKPISGLIEIQEDAEKDRDALIRTGVVGIGPPDLVFLEKKHSKNRLITSIHHVSGFDFNNDDSFLKYYQMMVKNRPKKMLGKHRYDVNRCIIYSFNSFVGVDLRVEIKEGKILSMKTLSKDGENRDPTLDEEFYQQLRISSLLRFWMPSSPIFRALFNYPIKNCSALNLRKPDENFSGDDIMYIINNHPISDELEGALAVYLISLGDGNKIISYLNKIIHKIPRIILHFIMLLPNDCSLTKEIATISRDCFEAMPDSIHVAYACLNFAIATNNLSLCETAVPLLLNGIWSSPLACFGLALLSLHNNSYEDALYYANASCYSRAYKKGKPEELSLYMGLRFESKKIPKVNPKNIERNFIASQNSGHYFMLYRIIVAIAKAISPASLRSILKSKLSSQEDTSSFQKDFYDNRIFSEVDDLDELYDPGVGTIYPETPFYIKRLNLSKEFYEIASSVLDDIHTRDTIIKTKRLESAHEAKRFAIIAFNLGDIDFFNIAYSYLKKLRKVRALIEILRYKMSYISKYIPFDAAFPINKMTMNEHNCFLVIKKLSDGIEEMI